jgi:hypothetical protein
MRCPGLALKVSVSKRHLEESHVLASQPSATCRPLRLKPATSGVWFDEKSIDKAKAAF